MRIRTQLIVAFLLLAVLPLAGMVGWSYVSSERAVRRAFEAEARALTEDMGERMAVVRRDLAARVAQLSQVPFGQLVGGQTEGEVQILGRVAGALGDLVPLVDALEFVPSAPPAPPPSAVEPLPGMPAPAPPAPPSPEESPRSRQAIVIRVAPLIAALRNIDREAASRPPGSPELEALAAARADMAREVQRALAEAAAELRAAKEVARESAAAGGEMAGEALAPFDVGQVVAPLAELPAAERAAMAADAARTESLLGGTLDVPVERDGTVIGTVQARLRGDAVLRQVLARTRRDQGEVPFAVDTEGNVYTASEADRKALAGLPIADLAGRSRVGQQQKLLADWTVVTSREDVSGVVFGIARPIGPELVSLKRTAVYNLGLGTLAVALALLGVLPLSGRLTRGLRDLGRGAERVALGDLTTRVPAAGPREIRQLAQAFNRMAEDLSRQQARLLEEERRRREEEVAKRLLAAEVAQKTAELEEARAFQLALLPKSLPPHPAVELGVFMRTATEVGGDYYDFLPTDDGGLLVAVGDATGHGAKAGSMVMAIKSLLAAAGERAAPGVFLSDASRAIKRMDLGRMAMGLALARIAPGATAGGPVRVVLASAGMPPVLVHRAADGRVEEIAQPAVPLGSLLQEYGECSVELAPGDALLLLSDGFPELPDERGEPLGYPAVRARFASAAAQAEGPRAVIGALSAALDQRTGGGPPADDVTFVVLQARREARVA
jgi:serine phosphatase RsbU (regulator of sigma subunit)